MKTPTIPPALRQHFADMERAKRILAAPAPKWAKQLREQDKRLAAIVAAATKESN